METPDFLVIGGGLVGCTLARELARVSRRVTVLERGLVGSGASSAAAGLLVPQFGAAATDPLIELCHQSAALYESWVAELREEGAGDVGYCRRGLLDVWTDAAQEDQARTGHAALVRAGRKVELLSGAELRRHEPALAPGLRGASFYVEDAQVDAPSLIQAVAGVAQRAGVTIREQELIERLVRDGDRVSAVHTDRAVYQPGTVVLCAGAWTGAVAGQFGVALPTRPVKGQMLMADCRVSPVRTPVSADPGLLVPRTDGRLTLGVTVEEAGFDNRVTLAGLQAILTSTSALAPDVGALPLARAWAGLRPANPDGWPYMGPVPPLRNLWVSTGHFRKGILLAPLCARLMARSILANRLVEELAPFKPTRRLAG